MWLASLRRLLIGKPRSPQTRPFRSRRRIVPTLDYLEDRIALSTITVGASDVSGLVAAITQANTDSQHSIADTIDLTNSTYTISTVNNSTNGPNALPVITATNLTINGAGSTLDGASMARLFDVGTGASVAVNNLTLSYGLATGSQAQGGGLFNNGGNVTMTNVTFEYNDATAAAGQNAQGGGLYSAGGTVTLNNVALTGNEVIGGNGASGTANQHTGGTGGNAQGGGIYTTGATVTLSGGSATGNTIEAGDGGNGAAGTALNLVGGQGGIGGNAQGGGVYVEGGSLTLTNQVAISTNEVNTISHGGLGGLGGAGDNAAGGTGGAGGNAAGGGVYASKATVLVTGGATINTNDAYGGGFGTGGNGGQGGKGGLAQGGGLFANAGSVTVNGASSISYNTALGGAAGNGGTAGGNGGTGGDADGGDLAVTGASVAVSGGVLVNDGTATGGQGGAGGAGGAGAGGIGGVGGQGQGGGFYANGSSSYSVNLNTATVNANTATGGMGGTGGAGSAVTGGGAGGIGGAGGNSGARVGGGVAVFGEGLSLNSTSVNGNVLGAGQAGSGGIGGSGKVGGIGGNGATGGAGQGGGLFVSGSTGTVLNSTIAENLVNQVRGGTGGSGGTISTTYANTGTGGRGGNGGTGSSDQGGGLFAASSTLTVLNSTLAGNILYAGTSGLGGTAGSGGGAGSAGKGGAGQGGGLFATSGSLTLTNDTIASNQLYAYTDRGASTGQGAGVYNDSTNTLHLENTIIALDQLYSSFANYSTYTSSDLFGNAASSDHDLIGDGTGSNLTNGTNGDQVGTAIANLNPQLMALNFYGGPTETMPLATNSPALNAGDASAATAIAAAEGVPTANATDQRGFPRVVNGQIDIGSTQSGLLLYGSGTPATVQPGQNITYTLTVSNNGPTTVTNVALSDVVPANTTYVSMTAPSGWSTPTLSSGTVSTSIPTLAANTTATFTLVVKVSSGAASGTTIADTANITFTGSANPVSTSVTMNTTVGGSTTTNITSDTDIKEGNIRRDRADGANRWQQTVTITNISSTTFTGPVALVLTGLHSNVTLVNATGTTDGSPYIDIVSGTGTFNPGKRNRIRVTLEFAAASKSDIAYTPQIEQGI